MGRRSIEEHNIRNLQKTAGGKSYIITLPINLVKELKWQERQRLVVERHEDGLIIKDYK